MLNVTFTKADNLALKIEYEVKNYKVSECKGYLPILLEKWGIKSIIPLNKIYYMDVLLGELIIMTPFGRTIGANLPLGLKGLVYMYHHIKNNESVVLPEAIFDKRQIKIILGEAKNTNLITLQMKSKNAATLSKRHKVVKVKINGRQGEILC